MRELFEHRILLWAREISALSPLQISDVLPHKPPMRLLDGLESADAHGAVCTVLLRPDSPFVEEGRVRAHVAIEYMAQTVAAYAGALKLSRGEGICVGYLLGARDVKFGVEWLEVGDALRVEARHVWGDAVLGSFTCKVSRRGELVAEGSLNVYSGALAQTGTR